MNYSTIARNADVTIKDAKAVIKAYHKYIINRVAEGSTHRMPGIGKISTYIRKIHVPSINKTIDARCVSFKSFSKIKKAIRS